MKTQEEIRSVGEEYVIRAELIGAVYVCPCCESTRVFDRKHIIDHLGQKAEREGRFDNPSKRWDAIGEEFVRWEALLAASEIVETHPHYEKLEEDAPRHPKEFVATGKRWLTICKECAQAEA
jgi:hypothetical protein